MPRPRLDILVPRLGLNAMTSNLRYDLTTSLFIKFIQSSFVDMCLRPLSQNFIYVQNSVFRCKLNVFGVCVLPREFRLIHLGLHGFLTALPRPDSQLPRLDLVNAA